MTNFEHTVLSIVSDCLNVNINTEYMEFCDGTLFINGVDDDEANRVLNNLTYNHRFGNVVMNRVGDEFAFDFVA